MPVVTTAEYDAATGEERWSATHREDDEGTYLTAGIAYSPNPHQVFVTGSADDDQGQDFLTIAYGSPLDHGPGPDPGEELWVQPPGGVSLDVSPDGPPVIDAQLTAT